MGFDSAQPDIKLYPNPVDKILNVECEMINDGANCSRQGVMQITNSLGQLVREEEIEFKEHQANINTKQLEAGIYFIKLSVVSDQARAQSTQGYQMSKRFVISR